MEEGVNAENVCIAMKFVTSLSPSQARIFFLRQQSYCNFEVPEYFVFEDLLQNVALTLGDNRLSDYYSEEIKPDKLEGVNHKLISNKDGYYAWRPFQLIHPALYVELVNLITQDDNWNYINSVLNERKSRCTRIHCASLPVVNTRYKKDRSEQISAWSSLVEKPSVVESLDYEYLHHTDIADCYGSIYTHALCWALHGIEACKESKRESNQWIGGKIDRILRNMSHGQTNGIPQGSVLMDFMAEIVLSLVDEQLNDRIRHSRIKPSEYKIIRYRDDYRIFTNNPQNGDYILKELTDVLHILGMKISSDKTNHSNDVVHSSLKNDKLWVYANPREYNNFLSELYGISTFGKKYPNSGQLIVQLTDFYRRLKGVEKKNLREHRGQLISIAVDIASKHPRSYPIIAAILSKLLHVLPVSERKRFVIKIRKKLEQLPNTNILQLWMQRIKADIFSNNTNVESLCLVALGTRGTADVWNSEWLNPTMKNVIWQTSIVDAEKMQQMPYVVAISEIELFTRQYNE